MVDAFLVCVLDVRVIARSRVVSAVSRDRTTQSCLLYCFVFWHGKHSDRRSYNDRGSLRLFSQGN